MTLTQWTIDRINNSTGVNQYVGSTYVFINKSDRFPSSTSGMIVIGNVSWTKNLVMSRPIISIKGLSGTKSIADSLGAEIVNLFDSSTKVIKGDSTSLQVESVEIINYIEPPIWDDANKKWYTVTDVLIEYRR